MTVQRTLPEWVDYIQTLHHRQIDLSLDRIGTVYRRLVPSELPFKVISIAGTNGKGSTAEIIASIYRAGGYQVGKYTSPHLVNFNERININGEAVCDAQLLVSFERIEAARGAVAITFFEFGTLLAVDLFLGAGLDIAIMEVGLGGRMDAVNVIDADVAAITNISLDHTAWLGNSVDEIALEKSGIARAAKPCLVGMQKPPSALHVACHETGAQLETLGEEFSCTLSGDEQWTFSSPVGDITGLTLPYGQTGVQLENAALAIRASEKLARYLPITERAICFGVERARLPGRCQIWQTQPLIVLDVAHNEASVNRLASFVNSCDVKGEVVAVCGMLKDKEISDSLSKIAPEVSAWHLASIDGERGSSSNQLSLTLIGELGINESNVVCYDRVEDAYADALKTLTADDCLLVFGSFYIVGDILRMLDQ